MLIRGTEPASCFGLGGTDENAGTSALGWCIEHVPSLRQEILKLLRYDSDMELVVASQVFGADKGFTDLELFGQTCHVIIEAKLGWQVPGIKQLKRYAPRLGASGARRPQLVSLSAADSSWATRQLPADIDGIPSATLCPKLEDTTNARAPALGRLQRLTEAFRQSCCPQLGRSKEGLECRSALAYLRTLGR